MKYVLITFDQYQDLQKGFDNIINEANRFILLAPDPIKNIISMAKYHKELLKKYYENGVKILNEHYDEVVKFADKKPVKNRDALIPENMMKQFKDAIEFNLNAVRNIYPSLSEALQNTLDFIISISKKTFDVATSFVEYIKSFPFILMSCIVIGALLIYSVSRRRE